jgi:hypothetical protein
MAMKKFLIGCSVVLLILALVAGWAFWRFVWQPGSQLVGDGIAQVTESVRQVQSLGKTATRLSELEQEIRNQSDFAPPADGLITPDQLARWLTVELTAREAIGADLKRLEQEASEAVTAPEGSAVGNAERTRAALATLGQLGEVATRGKQAQVTALNAAEMSISEYRWIRDTGIAALLAGGVSIGLDQLGQTAAQAEQARKVLEEAQRTIGAVAPELRGILDQLPGLMGGETPTRPETPEETPDPSSAETTPPADGSAPPTTAGDDARDQAARANFELVKDYAEAFAGARMLAVLGI